MCPRNIFYFKDSTIQYNLIPGALYPKEYLSTSTEIIIFITDRKNKSLAVFPISRFFTINIVLFNIKYGTNSLLLMPSIGGATKFY